MTTKGASGHSSGTVTSTVTTQDDVDEPINVKLPDGIDRNDPRVKAKIDQAEEDWKRTHPAKLLILLI